MQPRLWHPPVELSNTEQEIVKRLKRAKLFIFLRQVRHQIFDDEFQTELTEIFDDNPKGQPPIPPALTSTGHDGSKPIQEPVTTKRLNHC